MEFIFIWISNCQSAHSRILPFFLALGRLRGDDEYDNSSIARKTKKIIENRNIQSANGVAHVCSSMSSWQTVPLYERSRWQYWRRRHWRIDVGFFLFLFHAHTGIRTINNDKRINKSQSIPYSFARSLTHVIRLHQNNSIWIASGWIINKWTNGQSPTVNRLICTQTPNLSSNDDNNKIDGGN